MIYESAFEELQGHPDQMPDLHPLLFSQIRLVWSGQIFFILMPHQLLARQNCPRSLSMEPVSALS